MAPSPQFPASIAVSIHTARLHFIRTHDAPAAVGELLTVSDDFMPFAGPATQKPAGALIANCLLACMFRLVASWKREWVDACISPGR